MTFAFETEPAPLRQDEHGVIRVGKTRVLFELVVRAFENGATAEEIAIAYPTVNLADVYGAISYYLHHPAEVAGYLAERERRADEIRKKIEAQQPDMADIRRRLLKRRDSRNAAPPTG